MSQSVASIPSVVFLAAAWLVVLGQRAGAQGETARANPAAPPEVRQYQFMLGDWIGRRIDTAHVDDASRASIRWHGTYILGGWAVRTDWETTYASGTIQRGTMLRTYDTSRQEWQIAETYSIHPRLDLFTARTIGDSLVQSSEHQTPAGRLLSRRVYFNIQANAFEDRVETSRDGGRTWSLQFRESFVRVQ